MRPTWQLFLALIFSVIYLLVGADGSRKVSSRYAGPYKIKMVDFVRCNHTKPEAIETYLFCNKRDKTHDECSYLHGNISIDRDFNDNKIYPGSVIMNQWRDREWKRDGVIMKFPDGINTFRTFLPEMWSYLFDDSIRPKKKVYTVVELPIHIDLKQIPVFPYGRWKAQITLLEGLKATSCVMCFETILDIVRK